MQQDLLHVAEVLKGGTSSYLEELLPYQASVFGKGKVRVLIPAGQQSDLPCSKSLDTTCYDDSGSRKAHVMQLMKHVRALVNERRPTLIHAHGTFAGVAVRLALLTVRNAPPVVYCAHGWAFDREGAAWKNKVIATIERLLSPLAKKTICISAHDKQSAIAYGFNPDRLVVVLNGIRDESAGPSGPDVSWPEGKRRLLFAGRFDRQKGVDIFFDAMAKLGDGYFAYAIGDASVGDETLSSNVPSNVKLTGWLPRAEVQGYLSSADVFVMPSRWEGFGLSALEAMRAGKAVVASQVGGLPELIQDQVNGRLVSANSVDALAKALSQLSDSDAKRMGKASRDIYEAKFKAERMNAEILCLYDSITGTC